MPRRDRRPTSGHGLAATPFTRGLETRVLRDVRRHGALRSGERALMGVSGGQDSVALLVILARLAEELGIGLAVAHFNHMLRSPEESRDDEASVGDLAARLGLPFVTGSGDARRRARRSRETIEEAARYLRFRFLGRQAKSLQASVVALGHTRDDRAETVLLHLLRGSGLDGLVGLRPRSTWPFGRGPAVVRPLVDIGRADTLRYCHEAGVTPRQDPTNLLLDATRNRVRHELLPALRRFNPRLEEALCRLGAAAAGAVDHLDAEADALWRTLASAGNGTVTFARGAFGDVDQALRARLLRRAVKHAAGSDAELEAVHIAAVEEALVKRRSTVSLPSRLVVTVDRHRVRIAAEGRNAADAVEETALTVPGRTELPGWTVTTEVVRPPPADPRPRARYEAWLDREALGSRIVVRSRRPGDRVRPLGLGGTKKVQDILVDAKVPVEERDSVPLVCGSSGIAWVVGVGVDQRAALREGSRTALHVRFRRGRRGR